MPNLTDAFLAFALALVVVWISTPVVKSLAWRIGAIDEPRERGLHQFPTPRLGGLAILAGIIAAGLAFLPHDKQTTAILFGAGVIVAVGVADDLLELSADVKLAGQILAAVVPVANGVRVDTMTLPFLGHIDLGHAAYPLTVIGIVAVMNMVNFIDGVDGLAAGVCTIAAMTFAVIALSLHRNAAGVLAMLTAGAALGYLRHGFHPASIFLGDSGSNLLGYLLGVAAVIGSLKTNAVVALVVPLCILAVPFLDTSFVVAKRLKYRRKPWAADANHFHHRMARIGFSERKTVAYLYAWSVLLAGVAVALRYVPYHHHNPAYFRLGWTLVMGAIVLIALAASVYLIYVLEILKFKSRRTSEIKQEEPTTSEHEIEERVRRDVETGEFERVG